MHDKLAGHLAAMVEAAGGGGEVGVQGEGEGGEERETGTPLLSGLGTSNVESSNGKTVTGGVRACYKACVYFQFSSGGKHNSDSMSDSLTLKADTAP